MTDKHEAQTAVPLLSIWLRPRVTVRNLIEKKSYWPAYLFAAISGIVNAFDFVQQNEWGARLEPATMIVATIGAGIVTGIGFLLLLALFFQFFGRWLGGKGSFGELSIAVGWAMLPFVGTFVISIAEFSVYGTAFLTGGEALLEAQAANTGFHITMLLLSFVLAVYAIIMLAAGIAEAHRISVMQGIGVLFIFAILYLIFWISIQAISIGI